MTKEAAMRLSDICDFAATPVDPRDRPDDVYVGLEHIMPGRFERIGAGTASEVQSGKYAFQPGDVLYGKLRPYLDKAVLARDAGICTTELLVLRPKEGIDPRFLACVVHAPSFVEHAIAGTTGVQHPRTSWNHISSFELPDFTPDEQTAIATILWEVHDALMANEEAIDAGADLKRAAMRVLFTRGLRGEAQKETEIGPVPESWETSRVADAVRPYRVDRTKQIPASAYAQTGKWPIIDQGQKPIAGYTDDPAHVIQVKKPLIIFGDHTRTIKFVDFEFAVGADGTKLLTAVDGFEPKFLFHALCNLDVPARGYNRHYTILSEMILPKPAKEEQRNITSILDAIDRKIDLHQRKRAVLEDLFKTLLHKLMTGEVRVQDLDLSALVPTPPKEAAA